MTGVQTCALPISPENGAGAALAMANALRDAGIEASQIGYVNAQMCIRDSIKDDGRCCQDVPFSAEISG